MHNPFRLAYAALALSVAVAAGCGSSTSAPNNSPEGGMWVANAAYDTTPEFSTNQLGTSGSVAPAVRLITESDCGTGLALDASGNMWHSDCDIDEVLEYSPNARNAGGAATPTATITSTALGDAGPIAFDSHGNLWVSNCEFGILEFTTAQLAAAGTQTPNVVITPSGIESFCSFGIAFDANGNAWVGDDENPEIYQYSAAQLTSSGAKTPAKVITSAALVDGGGVVFDGSGNLWVSNDGGGSMLEYTSAQVGGAGGTLTPNAIVTLPTNGEPIGGAFDTHGSLWVSDYRNGVMYSFTSSQLVTGTPTPSITLGTTFEHFFPVQPLFDPYATTKGVAAARLSNHPVASFGTARAWFRTHHHSI